MTRLFDAKTSNGKFKSGWYMWEDYYTGKDGVMSNGWRFCYTIGEVKKDHLLVNNSRAGFKQFIEEPTEAIFL